MFRHSFLKLKIKKEKKIFENFSKIKSYTYFTVK